MTRILIVEDDPWYGEQQQRVLRKAGYMPCHAANPHAAMQLLDQQLPKAIILDILLAYNTAFVLLHELQASRETAGIPVVVYTTQAELLASIRLENYGIVSVLDKTIMTPNDTVRALKRLGV